MPARLVAALLALLAALTVLAVAPIAGAAKPHATTVVVSEKFPAFHGTVRSDDDSCVAGRKVTVTRKLNGKTTRLGSALTDSAGKWKVPVPNLTSGEFFATVAAKGECQGVRSQPVVVD
jgi:hypothetical protein